MQFTNAYALLSVLRLIKITEATWHAAAQTSCSGLNSSTWTKLDQQFDNPIRDWTRSFKPPMVKMEMTLLSGCRRRDSYSRLWIMTPG